MTESKATPSSRLTRRTPIESRPVWRTSAAGVRITVPADVIARISSLSLTINAPTGTASNGLKLVLRITDNGTNRALTWNAIFQEIGVTLPTTTTATKTIYVGLIYNATATKWDVVAIKEQA